MAAFGAGDAQPKYQREFSHVDKNSGELPYKEFQTKVLSMQLEDLKDYKGIIRSLTEQYKKNWDMGLGAESFVEDTFMRSQLRNAIFVGHVNTDLDSIAGAVGAAELYRGQPARAEGDLNGEILCALKWIGMDPPPVFDSLPGAKTSKVCLVDHNEVDQMTPILKKDEKRMKRIVGLIDHHAVASNFTSSSPLFMDTRPWGSMAAIVFHTYLRNRVPIRKEIARLLLCAILSDTLNLKSGTTTPADRFCVALLSSFGEVDDIDDLAMRLFTAKTDWIVGLGAYEMCRGDQKNFEVKGVRLSIAVLEVTAVKPVMAIAEDLMIQLRVFKYEKGDFLNEETQEQAHDTNKEAHCALLFVVDTVKQESVALVCGAREQWLLDKAFPEGTWSSVAPGVKSPSAFLKPEQTMCSVGKMVSRKLDFVPRCTDAINGSELPDWYMQTSKEMESLGKVLASGKGQLKFTTKVEWDREALRSAVWPDEAPGGKAPAKGDDKCKGSEAPPKKGGWKCSFLTGKKAPLEDSSENKENMA